MNLKKKFVVGAASLALVAGMGVAPAMAAGDVSANRWGGADRYDTAIQVALKGWSDANGENPSAGTVYVSNGASLVDAIAGGVLKNGPMLLVNESAAVQSKVADAIKTLKATKVIALGGTGAVSDEALKAVAGTAVTERISGADRFETAANIAEAAFKQGVSKDRVYLANGQTLVDALVGGQLTDGVILLTDGADKLPAATSKELNKIGSGASLYALGGAGAVSDEVLKNAAVSQTILIDSFLEDNKAAVKASAEADIAVNGWVKAGPGVSQDDVFKAGSITDAVMKAKIAATWPKIDYSLAPAGTLYLGEVDDKIAKVAKPAANALSATGMKSDGSEDYTFAGTTGAAVRAQAFATGAPAAKAALDGAATGFGVFDLDKALGDTTAANNAAILPQIQALYPDVDVKMTAEEWLTSLGVDTNAAWSQPVFNAATQAAVDAAKKAATEAGAANTAAVKAKTEAQKALDKLRNNSGIVNTNVNRLGGADRFETAVKIAAYVYGEKGEKVTPSRIYFANGTAFADAAVAGYIDNSNRPGPVLLVSKDSVPSVTGEQALAWDKVVDYVRANVTFIGGNGVISDENGAAELETLAPATTAAGTVSFGNWIVDAASAQIAITTKDMPNGSTLEIEWYGRTGDSGTGVKIASGNTFGGQPITLENKDDLAKATYGGLLASGSEIRVKVIAKNSSGEVITETYSTWYKYTKIDPTYADPAATISANGSTPVNPTNAPTASCTAATTSQAGITVAVTPACALTITEAAYNDAAGDGAETDFTVSITTDGPGSPITVNAKTSRS